MADIQLRRSKSLKTANRISREDPLSSSNPTVVLRDRKKKKSIRKRFSLSFTSIEKEKEKEREREKLIEGKETCRSHSRKISIDENVSFSHKEHVGKEEANQFLLRLLKLREEKYMEMHQQIRDNITSGYMYLRPPAHMVHKFQEIVEDSSSFRRRKKKTPKPGATIKSVKFWLELVPQVSEFDSKESKKVKKKKREEKEEIIIKKKKKKNRLSAEKREKLKIQNENTENNEKQITEIRYEEIHYFPENLPNVTDKSKDITFRDRNKLPTGSPDYLIFVYSSEYKRGVSQILAVIPLTDVKVTPINPVEFSIRYVNRLPNSHCFRADTPELMQRWLKTFELATQQEIYNPFENTRTRGHSISHGISLLRAGITPMVRYSKSSDNVKDENNEKKDDGLSYYKPICWNINDLKHEGGDAFSKKLQFQEVYSNDEVDNGFTDSVRQGWRMLGGTLSDIITWCILTSHQQDKQNIDSKALFLEYPDNSLIIHIKEVLKILKNRITNPKKEKGKRFFRNSISGNSNSDIISASTDDIKEENISTMVNLERRLYNFLFQWITVKINTISDISDLKENVKPILELTRFQCGIDKSDIMTTFINNLTNNDKEKSIQVSFSDVSQPEFKFTPITDQPLVSFSSITLAEQLTIMEIEFYSQLRLPEFLNLAWDKTPECAPGVIKLIEHYNQMGLWVATEVLNAGTPKVQAKTVAKFLRIAQKLLTMRNYATCAQILSGVSNRAVQRLKKVHKYLDWKTAERYEQMNNIFDPVSGYSNYRKLLDHSPPTIPFIAVTLRTLTLIEEGNPKVLGDDPDVISFARMVMYTECIEKLNLGNEETMNYQFQKIQDIQDKLHTITVMNEEELFSKSEELEPLRGGLAKKKEKVET